MADETELTPSEALIALLVEVRAMHHLLRSIEKWVAFAGIILLIEVVFSACRVLVGL